MLADGALGTTATVDLDAIIATLAQRPDVDMDKLLQFITIKDRMYERQQTTAFNTAFHAMEPRIPRIKKNGTVEYKKKNSDEVEKAFKFSRWEDVDSQIRPILREYGFALSFETQPRQGDGGGLLVTGILMHVAGFARKASIPLALDVSGGKNNIQAAGSTFSYGCRYTTRMLLNLVAEGEDDDGQSAHRRYVTLDEAAELTALIEQTATDPARFFHVMCTEPVSRIEEVAHADFPRLRQSLLVKRDKKSAQ